MTRAHKHFCVYTSFFKRRIFEKEDRLQSTGLNTRTKSKMLMASSLIIALALLPFAFPHILIGHGSYFAIHIASISLGTFLSIVGFFTYREFRLLKLFLIMLAFMAITIGEAFSFVNMITPFFASTFGFDSLISHGFILLMLTFFVVGIFRSN